MIQMLQIVKACITQTMLYLVVVPQWPHLDSINHLPTQMLIYKSTVLYWKGCKPNYHSRVPVHSTHMGYYPK